MITPRTEKTILSRVRRSPANVNAGQKPVSHRSRGGSSEPPVTPDPPGQPDPFRRAGGPLLNLRSAVILGAAVLVSAVAGILTYLLAHSLPAAFLAAGPAFVGSVALFNAIIAS